MMYMDDILGALKNDLLPEHIESLREAFKLDEVVDGLPGKFLG